MKLIRYRDANMKHYTYFWVDENDIVISPYFTDEQSANLWHVEASERNHDPRS